MIQILIILCRHGQFLILKREMHCPGNQVVNDCKSRANHYFGITDLKTISDAGKSSAEKMENFRYLTSDERVEHVMKQAEYFGHSGERVKGLIFCSRIDEANVLLW